MNESKLATKPELAVGNGFLREVYSMPGGEGVLTCIQCGTCSGSCPNAPQMDYPPRKIIALIRAGDRQEVLNSNSMWFCASCYLCTVRCPREVKITELMHSLEILATYHHLTSRRTHTPAMYRYFVNSIKANGRVHEFGFMMRYYLSTNPFSAIKIAPVGINMLRRGRLSLRAEKIKGRDQLKAIREKAQALGGV